MDNIMKIISMSSGLTPKMIRERTSRRGVLKWRQLYYWSLRKYHSKTLDEIALEFGVSLTTVMRGADSVDEKIKTDIGLKECFNELKKYHE